MDSSNVSGLSLNDIVFSGRNKQYGAYVLRKLYHKHILLASCIASAVFLVTISIPLVVRLLEQDDIVLPVSSTPVTLTEVLLPPVTTEAVIPPPPPPAKKTVAAPAPAATAKYTPPVVKPDNQVQQEENIPDVASLKGMNIGTKTIAGEPGGIPDIGIPGGTGTAAVLADVIEEPPHNFVEQMPAFPGGDRALFEYLGKNIKYPRAAIAAGIEGQVFVSFVVSKNGEINEVQVLRGLGAGCDEEAIRVIQGMPKWSPGKQNGRTVPVRYNLPIKFSLK